GGKSLGASIRMQDGGVLVCNEFVPNRCKTLVGNIERFAVKNSIVTNFDMTEKNELCDIYEDFFDLVICDAPCSGEGMFRKYPEQAISEWSVENVRICAERQKEILDNAAIFVKNGGLLLYSTCTFSLDENEMQADEFLSRHPDFELIPVSEKVQDATVAGYIFDGYKHESISQTRRFYPHISRGEGQFIALFRKSGTSENMVKDKYKNPLSKPSDNETKILAEFVKKTLNNFDFSKVYKYNENLIYVYFDAKIPSKKVFSCGVKLGEVVKNRFEPHHQFFKCFGNDFKNVVTLCDGDKRLSKYLHGEVIDAEIPNGWCAICYENLVLGGGKVVDGTVKNHYPKGLRTV
ncbi:MAG: RsmF rRNA methyltransferase first C-terminal domain-containing protein, partial [Clostridia bacterium]|nr:RsmF rRNA methyltransferase first C-terminal domain-containing protein [Clostridia bacterium]